MNIENIELKKLNYKMYLPLDIIAISFAEGGAMGCPGEIVIVTFDQRVFSFNHCYGDLEVTDIYKICPVLRECTFGPFNSHELPIGWKYYYLGAGNHLILSGRVCWEFDRANEDSLTGADLYQAWLGLLMTTLRHNYESSNAMRTRIFQETVQCIKQGFYYTPKGTKIVFPQQKSFLHKKTLIQSVFYEHELPAWQPVQNNYETTIVVENTDCLMAGRKLQEQGYNVAVLNMASRRCPGGGVVNGARAQEENLFRRTNLFQSMFQFAPYASKYGVSKSRHQYPLDRNFGGVYTCNATVFRAGEKNGYEYLENPFQISFISVPGMNRPELTDDGMIAKHLVDPIKNKIRTIFRIGLINGHNALVLGALGCGAFRNPPRHIAKLFHEVIEEQEFKNQYKCLLFAILEDHNSHLSHNPEGNYKPFVEEFRNNTNINP